MLSEKVEEWVEDRQKDEKKGKEEGEGGCFMCMVPSKTWNGLWANILCFNVPQRKKRPEEERSAR